MKKTFYPWIFALSVWAASAHSDAAATDNELLAGPYVPSANQVSAVVAFELAEPSTSTVTVKNGEERLVFKSEVSQRHHFVTIDGLLPGRAYEYFISLPLVDLGGRGEGLIRTASLSEESFTFTVIGDTRPGENRSNVHHAGLAEQIALLDPAFSLVLGDLVDDGSDPVNWRRFFEVEKEVMKRAAVFPVLGDNDHSNGEGLMSRYFPQIAKGYYSFEWGGVHFFGLSTWDTKGRQPKSEYDETSEQFQWLASELAKPEVQEASFRVVFLHDPVFISRGRGSRVLQETMAPLFERHKVDLVFASWHLYERSRVKQVNYIISGGGGAELIWNAPNPEFKAIADAKRYHFCRVDVGAGGLTLRAIAEDGTVLDQVSLATNVGDDTSDDELSRFASRMATLETYGENRETVLPVVVFDANEEPFQSRTSLIDAARELDVTIAVYSFNLRKKAVFDLLQHLRGATGAHIEHLPVVFLGGQHLEDLDQFPNALRKASLSSQRDLFKEKTNPSEIRISTFGAVGTWRVVANGLSRCLTVGNFLWLVCFSLFLFILARRDGPVIRMGGAVLGIAFLFCMLWGIFYFNVIKHIPSPDWFASLLGPRDRELVFFEIQGMLKDPSFRGDGLKYLVLSTSSVLLPTVVMMVFVKMIASRMGSGEEIKSDDE